MTAASAGLTRVAAQGRVTRFVSRHRAGVLAAGLLSGPVAILCCLLLVALLLLGGNPGTAAATCTLPVGAGGTAPTELTGEQTANATTIIGIGRAAHVSPYGWVIAVAAAMTESGLRNLDHGDRDSLGLFQQRPSQGWGTRAQIMDPSYTSAAFYGGLQPPANTGLLDVAGWQQMDVATAAQAVQRSAFPGAYAQWAEFATAVVSSLTGASGGCQASALPDGAAGAMLAVVLAQVGKPYIWGATGPDAFDCSGLVVYSWRQAGYALPARTAAQMHKIADPIPPGQQLPGDLIFSEFGSRGLPSDSPGHVAVVVGSDMLAEAPTEGVPVRVRRYDPADPTQRFGRFPPAALRPVTPTPI
ncbi:MAG: NlpC/P60 family protein [Pseudonocardiales bacterium]